MQHDRGQARLHAYGQTSSLQDTMYLRSDNSTTGIARDFSSTSDIVTRSFSEGTRTRKLIKSHVMRTMFAMPNNTIMPMYAL